MRATHVRMSEVFQIKKSMHLGIFVRPWRWFLSTLLSLLCLIQHAQLHAEKFQPDHIVTQRQIAAGANVFLNELSWDGASRIHVFGIDDFAYKGSMPGGLNTQMQVLRDGKTLYLVSSFAERIVYGQTESVVQIYDVSTLSRRDEFVVPNTVVRGIGMTQMLALSADKKLLYIQNATPATSVTVIDLAAKKRVTEIPAPGCFGIYPARDGHRFSTACGTGVFKTFTVAGDSYSVETSAPLFDVTKDPIYIHASRRANGELILTTFGGDIYLADDSGKVVRLIKTLSVSADIEGNWAPGGYRISAYNGFYDTIFIPMHRDAKLGSHKYGSDEIWAYSLKEEKLVARSVAQNLVSLAISAGPKPIIFGSNAKDNTVDKYELKLGDGLLFQKVASDKRAGATTTLAITYD
ncbi:Aralkylamine dehydrogenase heavy chain [BD1-7 clade bacterium]|uniref:Aralkylamine dehydrogenase heavy chain n=1 Tax=BD1-7 clade bacterium TaxID=2029982 RepID=A0A5S9MZU7_9GAMM|nr:Aralkylamine dehydrogenase heavy chain [BD1-7 clade bacterium]CAA0082592.1 Aralkylamine dehydrogenase heavy chain [BD1-7 clade bacterium]